MVCMEKVKNPKKIVECMCEYVACSPCTKRYLLEIKDDPHCMKCKTLWSREFLVNTLSRTWVDHELKEHRETVLIEREKAMIPATMEAAHTEKKKRTIRKEIHELTDMKNDLYSKIYLLNQTISGLEYSLHGDQSLGASHKKSVHKCQWNDCKGFVNDEWVCGVCEKKTCKQCYEPIDGTDHICNDDNVATAKEIAKCSKSCPVCGMSICKVEGCDQMWCPECKTPFSWKTGKIETGTIHNPHYFEYLRQADTIVERNPLDVRCGGMPDSWVFHNSLRPHVSGRDDKLFIWLSDIHRFIIHVSRVEIPRYSDIVNDTDNTPLRIKYILSDIDDTQFKKTLVKEEKKRSKSKDYLQLWVMFRDISTDNFIAFTQEPGKEQAMNLYNEQIRLKNYINDQLIIISSRYKTVTYQISPDWRSLV